MNEFELIGRYFTRPAQRAVLGVGDDCALLAPAQGRQLAISADMLVAGRHFFPDVDPYRLGHKALAVNLSDLAAMGAQPSWCTLSIALPAVDEAWLAAFSAGFFALADLHGVELVGGDTTRGPLTIAVQIAGEIEPGQALRRDGARIGDDIWVSGVLGAASVAVLARSGKLAGQGIVLSAEQQARCGERLDMPTPRVALGRALRGIAHAALDVSDGLLGDLRHIAARSGVAAELDWLQLPVDPAIINLPLAMQQQAVLTGGDEYELCFTAATAQRAALQALSVELDLPLTRIGRITAGEGVHARAGDGSPLLAGARGFDHFAA
ncbi:thiamine-monophosphate kinase [Andreprevotia lacus DSM 23236]|uniref:Thiamine-monophosphate kinase n=1 Tax=Andreprevotia lacus DSM 23236 TaxID=1121001 RepID=A0A1W1XNP1_9NEIS|nr:thiamine-phosphate kinase [Andreprevotia lacus]SMC25487.1 thiamine-monophosphate kinase [Andreprevotia lacus DSM 23236]